VTTNVSKREQTVEVGIEGTMKRVWNQRKVKGSISIWRRSKWSERTGRWRATEVLKREVMDFRSCDERSVRIA
jgi:hypothetical protein